MDRPDLSSKSVGFPNFRNFKALNPYLIEFGFERFRFLQSFEPESLIGCRNLGQFSKYLISN